MKRLIITSLVLVLTIVMAAPVMAQTTPAPATAKTEQPPLSPEDVKRLREAVQAITDALQGKKSQAEPEKAEKREEAQKNMADVADRALSILSGYISSAEQAFKKVAPEVWRVMIRQQYANAIAYPLIPLALLGFTLIFAVVTKRWWDKSKMEERLEKETNSEATFERGWRFAITSVIPGVLYFFFGIWATIAISGSIRVFINPEYYAFRNLLEIVLNRGGL